MSEQRVLSSDLWWVLDQHALTIDGLTSEQLHSAPEGAGATNSPAAIVGHTLAVTRLFVLGLGCDQDVPIRDREAEFHAAFESVAAAKEALRALGREIAIALNELHPQRLETGAIPAPAFAATLPRDLMTRRAITVEALRHAAIHLGELRLTRSLAGP